MVDHTVAAARACGALVVLPGTVYNFGPDAFDDMSEEAEQNPSTRKGAIRVEMERRLRLAAPWVPLFAEMKEMRYLWQQPIRMRNARLLSVLGHEPRTPLDEAVGATLAGLGCLPRDVATSIPRPGR